MKKTIVKFINPLTGEMRLINIAFNKALFFTHQ